MQFKDFQLTTSSTGINTEFKNTSMAWQQQYFTLSLSVSA